MLSRKVTSLLLARLEEYPAAALVGPRQSGKTTLARSIGGRYYDLEQEPDQLRLDIEWEEVSSGRELAILDEAQAWPEIFPRLRGAIDEDRRRNGRFLLLGSVSPALMTRRVGVARREALHRSPSVRAAPTDLRTRRRLG